MENSLINQQQYFQQQIEKMGYKLASDCGEHGIYGEEISGKDIKNRKELQKMLEDARQGKFDMIFTKSISRLGRNTRQILNIIYELRDLNIGVYFEDLNMDTLDPKNDMVLTMLSSVAQEEIRQSSDRIKFGLRQAEGKGHWRGHEPYGYDRKDKKLFINEKEAEVIKMIFNWYYYYGYGIGKIKNELNNMGIPTKKKKAKKFLKNTEETPLWSTPVVSRILENPIYKGEVRQHTIEIIDPINGIRKEVPESEHTVFYDESLKIIDEELFDKVQEEKQKRNKMFGRFEKEKDENGNVIKTRVKNREGRYSSKNLLSNLLYCYYCGGSFKRKKIKGYLKKNGERTDHGYEWTCTNRDVYGYKICDTEYRQVIREDDAIQIIKEIIDELVNHKYSPLEEYFMYYIKFKLGDEALNKLPDIKKEMKDLNEEIKRLGNLYAKGKINEEQYDELIEDKDKRFKELKAEKDKLENIDNEREKILKKKQDLINFIKNLDLNNLDNATLKKIFKRIYVDRLSPGEADILRTPVLLRPIYNFGIDITDKEIWELANQWIEQYKKEGKI